jgi:hypothetical protein
VKCVRRYVKRMRPPHKRSGRIHARPDRADVTGA